MPTGRSEITTAALAGRIFVAGGIGHFGTTGAFEVYDPKTDHWRAIADIPAPRGGHTAAAVAGLIHVTGGEASSPARVFAEHWVFDAAGNRWATLPDPPTPRHGLDSVSIDGEWYVIGGGTGAGARTLVTLTNVIEIYTPRNR